ncbi:uncharacterized protein BJX67DRAFT_384528 [Aspergillus lucknowensis]|uniref:Uncharacterized protein n=1 Tax=Aspergillus lucknowensis TaxID=176173 RepID=A0ABR4LHT7_9EURO
MTLFPRIQLFEFMDLPWCPEWFRVYAQSFLVGLWNLSIPSISVSTFAAAASDTILENFPDLSSFTFVDLCTGAGGPTPLIESRLHNSLRQQGKSAVRFVLTDLYPALEQWRDIAAKHENITYVEEALDARNCKRIAGPGRKEGRMLTASFHHLDDETAIAVLGDAIWEADAFIIQEGVQRDITSLLTCLFGCLFYPLVYTLAAPQY